MALGTFYALENKMSFGALLSFNTLFIYFQTPLRELIDLDIEIKEAKNAYMRMRDMMYFNKKSEYLYQVKDGDIVINDLNYSYKNQQAIIKHFYYTFKQGTKTIISGSSGVGKSTILKILMKYYPVKRDTVLIGGVDLNDIKKLNATFISQQEVIFTDTILNNIKLNREVDEQRLSTILNICRIDQIVAKHNLGYNFLVEENGANLSGGERQRIILARSLLTPATYLFVDEGLSEVDLNLERAILSDLISYFNHTTIIFVSHRLDNVDLFDEHLIIKGEKYASQCNLCNRA